MDDEDLPGAHGKESNPGRSPTEAKHRRASIGNIF